MNDERNQPILSEEPSTSEIPTDVPPATSAQQTKARIVSRGLGPEEMVSDEQRERAERNERFLQQQREKLERDARILATLEHDPEEREVDVAERIATALERIAFALESGVLP